VVERPLLAAILLMLRVSMEKGCDVPVWVISRGSERKISDWVAEMSGERPTMRIWSSLLLIT